MKSMRWFLTGLLVAACRGEGAPRELVVFAAASTSDVMAALAESFDGGRVLTSFGPSSALARQIGDGAPAGVYVSASREWIEFLEQKELLDGLPQVLCGNRLVCIAGEALPGVTSPAALARALAPDARLAIADAGVPAGEYARESLFATGDLDALRTHLVGQADVRAVLRSVAAGEAAAGFVYATDARSAAVHVLFTLDPQTHARIEYLAAIPRTAPDPALARAFLAHLVSPQARQLLVEAGFEQP